MGLGSDLSLRAGKGVIKMLQTRAPHSGRDEGALPGYTHHWPFDVWVNILSTLPPRLPSIATPLSSSQWWQRHRTQRSVISWLTPGLGCVTPAAVKRRSSLIIWVVLRDQWLKDRCLHDPANPFTLANTAKRGTVTGAWLPSPNRVTDTCLGRVQSYRHMLFNIHWHQCSCKTHYLPLK